MGRRFEDLVHTICFHFMPKPCPCCRALPSELGWDSDNTAVFACVYCGEETERLPRCLAKRAWQREDTTRDPDFNPYDMPSVRVSDSQLLRER